MSGLNLTSSLTRKTKRHLSYFVTARPTCVRSRSSDINHINSRGKGRRGEGVGDFPGDSILKHTPYFSTQLTVFLEFPKPQSLKLVCHWSVSQEFPYLINESRFARTLLRKPRKIIHHARSTKTQGGLNESNAEPFGDLVFRRIVTLIQWISVV